VPARSPFFDPSILNFIFKEKTMSLTPALVVTDQDFERLVLLLQHSQGPSAELLSEELSRAQVVKPAEISAEVVTMNSKIEFEDEETLSKSEITLVYPKDADVTQKKISVLAPVGVALMGLRVGQSINWKMPTGKVRKLRVTSVLYQPEAAGDWEL
jgi:regulator of nucleoside diphosphate kinase